MMISGVNFKRNSLVYIEIRSLCYLHQNSKFLKDMEGGKCQCSQFHQQHKHDEKYCSISPAHCPKTWPELVGLSGDEAAKVIKAEIPNLQVIQFIHPLWALTQ